VPDLWFPRKGTRTLACRRTCRRGSP
jgi:hypothetical protein